MATSADLRPAWQILKRARMPGPRLPGPKLAPNTRYLATTKPSRSNFENRVTETAPVSQQIAEANEERKGNGMRIPSPERTAENVAVEYPGLESESSPLGHRLPRAVQALYLRPLRREAEWGVPTCDLQLRSYNARSLEFFADFALRAAYYLHLPAYGPIPLPRITQRWTVPKSSFIFKKAQENFERVTVRRLIQIKDGHSESMDLWLAFLAKHQHHGVGMKANVWEYERLGVGKEMDVTLEEMADGMKSDWATFGRKHDVHTAQKVLEIMNSEKFRQAAGHAPR